MKKYFGWRGVVTWCIGWLALRTFELLRASPSGRLADILLPIAGNYIWFDDARSAFRANMLRRAQPGEDIDAEIDRVLAAMECTP